MKSIKLLTIAAAALALGGIAQAGAYHPTTSSVVVKYGDLDLETAEGVKVLRKRIRNAAVSVCASLETKVLGLRDAYEQCVDKAVTDGIAAVGNANLTSYHATKRLPAVASNRS